MRKELYWLRESWPGKLAMCARPRGGDWVRDDIDKWREAGIDTVLSLLTADEERDLDLRDEAVEVGRQRMEFRSFPIADRQVPRSEAPLAEELERVSRTL